MSDSDEANSLTSEVGADKIHGRPAFVFAVSHEAVSFDEAGSEREHESHGVLCYGKRRDAWSVRHSDISPFSLVYINIVVSISVVSEDLCFWRRVKDVAVDGIREEAENGVIIFFPELANELFLADDLVFRIDVHFVAFISEHRDRVFRDLSRYEYFFHAFTLDSTLRISLRMIFPFSSRS